MIGRTNDRELRRTPWASARLLLRLTAVLIPLLGSAGCSWLTGEFAALDRTPPSARPDSAPTERP